MSKLFDNIAEICVRIRKIRIQDTNQSEQNVFFIENTVRQTVSTSGRHECNYDFVGALFRFVAVSIMTNDTIECKCTYSVR